MILKLSVALLTWLNIRWRNRTSIANSGDSFDKLNWYIKVKQTMVFGQWIGREDSSFGSGTCGITVKKKQQQYLIIQLQYSYPSKKHLRCSKKFISSWKCMIDTILLQWDRIECADQGEGWTATQPNNMVVNITRFPSDQLLYFCTTAST